MPAARRFFNDARVLARACGADHVMGLGAISLAELEFATGNATAAADLASEALDASRTQNDPRRAMNALVNLSAYLMTLERYDEARIGACDALALTRDLQAGVIAAFALQHLGAIALFRTANRRHDTSVRAARLIGYVNAQLFALEAVREATEQQEYDKLIGILRDTFAEAQIATLLAEGAVWSEDEAVTEATLL